jgi:hypothetical protein
MSAAKLASAPKAMVTGTIGMVRPSAGVLAMRFTPSGALSMVVWNGLTPSVTTRTAWRRYQMNCEWSELIDTRRESRSRQRRAETNRPMSRYRAPVSGRAHLLGGPSRCC